MSTIDRRQFLQRILALGGGALATAALLSLASCGESTPESPTDGSNPPGDITPTDNTSPTENTTTPDNGAPPDGTTPTDNTTPPDDTPPPDDTTPPGDAAYLAVARGANPTTLVQRSIDALGGIGKFVKPGNDVIIKPNICNASRALYAETTTPEVVGALVALCLAAGANRVRVMDRSFNGSSKESYEACGIAAAVRAAGGQMEVMATMGFQTTPIPNGQSITSCRVYQEVLKADVLINVPVAKTNSDVVLTCGMKNLLGTVDNPNTYHAQLAESVTDLASLVMPDLTVIDAIRVTKAGGTLSDVKQMDTIIASHDIVAADSYAATLFGLTGADVPMIVAGARRGLGTMDLSSVDIKEMAV